MSQIELYLNNIRQKCLQLSESKALLTGVVSRLEKENLALKEEVERLKTTITSTQLEIVRLEGVVSEINQQGVGDLDSVVKARTNQEIDTLVQEIDQCIALLKGNK
ncbi:MAG: hypothetical protein ACKO4K_02115 [Flavobacteriales bacterium]